MVESVNTDRSQPALPEWRSVEIGDRAWTAWNQRPSPGPESDDLAWHGLAPILVGTDSERATEAMRRQAKAARAVCLAQAEMLQRCRDVLADLPHLWLKGVALGQYLYPDPGWRVGSDIDVLVPEPSHRAAWQRLTAAGLHPTLSAGGSLIVREQELVAQRGGFRVAVDLHWALSSHPALRDRLTWSMLRDDAIETPIGLALHPAHALLHAVIHRYGHHAHEPHRMLFLMDVDLLWRGFDSAGRTRIAEMACRLGIGRLLAAALDAAALALGTPLAGNEPLSEISSDEPTARFLRPPPPGHWFAWTSLPWYQRPRYLAQLMFPPIGYMRRRYPASGLPLPLLYGQRLVGGLLKALR